VLRIETGVGMENAIQPKQTTVFPNGKMAWYCVRSKPKHEHIAAANLRKLPAVETFNPCLRSRRATRRGPVWMTEALFPNYIFARFAFEGMFDEVRYTRGVSSLVHFGHGYPTVPEAVIDDLRQNFLGDELSLSSEMPSVGDHVTITSQSMFGLEGVVLRTMPAKKRVQILLDLLGQTSAVELNFNSVVVKNKPLPNQLLS
jgi:transcriptional antiterminator RfaH